MEAVENHLSLYMSKFHIVGNPIHWLKIFNCYLTAVFYKPVTFILVYYKVSLKLICVLGLKVLEFNTHPYLEPYCEIKDLVYYSICESVF